MVTGFSIDIPVHKRDSLVGVLIHRWPYQEGSTENVVVDSGERLTGPQHGCRVCIFTDAFNTGKIEIIDNPEGKNSSWQSCRLIGYFTGDFPYVNPLVVPALEVVHQELGWAVLVEDLQSVIEPLLSSPLGSSREKPLTVLLEEMRKYESLIRGFNTWRVAMITSSSGMYPNPREEREWVRKGLQSIWTLSDLVALETAIEILKGLYYD